MQTNTVSSVYIHIPFCKKICSYCDFCKNYYDERKVEEYLDKLEEEINNKYKGEIISTLYIGGGTPSCLSVNNLEKLFKIINVFNINKTLEFTFECNYEDINETLLIFLKENKVNRLSIGLQTFNKKFESLINRTIDKNKMIASIILSKKYFDNINVDLMYGFYNEIINELEEDIDEFIKLDVSHISTYALIIEEHTKLKIDGIKELDDDIQNDMYCKIINNLKKRGYKHYEISNFSKKGYESKHNIVYWNNEFYYGFGLGASSFINQKRCDNTKSMKSYFNNNFISYEEYIDINQMMNDEVMLNLRKTDGINKTRFKEKYNIDINDVFNIKNLVAHQIIEETKEHIFIPEDKLFVSNEIIIRFLDSRKHTI